MVKRGYPDSPEKSSSLPAAFDKAKKNAQKTSEKTSPKKVSFLSKSTKVMLVGVILLMSIGIIFLTIKSLSMLT